MNGEAGCVRFPQTHDGSMVLLYMVAFIINIAQMFAYIPAPWILWEMGVAQNDLLIVEKCRKSFYWYWQFIALSKNWLDRTNANIEKMRGASSHHKRIHIEYRSPTANGFTSNNWDNNQQIITRKKGLNSVALGPNSQHYKTTLNGINK